MAVAAGHVGTGDQAVDDRLVGRLHDRLEPRIEQAVRDPGQLDQGVRGRKRRIWSPATIAVSVGAHLLLLAGAVSAAVGTPERDDEPIEDVTYTEITPKPQEPQKPIQVEQKNDPPPAPKPDPSPIVPPFPTALGRRLPVPIRTAASLITRRPSSVP